MYCVAIDPGHGGDNWGTRHGTIADGDLIIEKEITLALGKRLQDVLMGFDGVASEILRAIDMGMPQSARGKLSASAGADLVVSLHVNSNSEPSVHGITTYHNPANNVTQRIGNRILAMCPSWLRGARYSYPTPMPEEEKDRWLEHPRAILMAHKADVILVECLFASNSGDRRILKSHEGRDAIAGIIAAAVLTEYASRKVRAA